MSTAIILGTARHMGNTHRLAQHVADGAAAELFDLADYDISPYDYQHRNLDDGFFPLMRKILTFDNIVLASPVYMYAPSSAMKTFIDRLTDLVTVEKDLGRQLRQKGGAIIATGCDKAAPRCFEEVFELTYAYLGLRFKSALYCPCDDALELHRQGHAIGVFMEQLHAQ